MCVLIQLSRCIFQAILSCNAVLMFPQVLSTMLNVNQFPFVIDLACWASRREFLKLDKWVSDKLKEHQVSWEERRSALPLCKFYWNVVWEWDMWYGNWKETI